jgi:hypothetical protein
MEPVMGLENNINQEIVPLVAEKKLISLQKL